MYCYMKIPKKIKIGGHEFKIVFKKASLVDEGNADSGSLDTDSNTIEINEKLTQSQKEVTLLHEIFHAMNTELNEVMVESLSQQLYQVFMDNKMFK